MATIQQSKHDLLKAKWQQIITAQRQSGLSIRNWCEENQISAPSFFYWNKVIRDDALIQAGVLAVTESSQFAEVTPRYKALERSGELSPICAVIRIQQSEVEIYNGADAKTLEAILALIGRQP